jgi:hypothetical protein
MCYILNLMANCHPEENNLDTGIGISYVTNQDIS